MPSVPGLARLFETVEGPLTLALLVLAFVLGSLGAWLFKLYRQSVAERIADRDQVARERLEDAKGHVREIARFNELLSEFNRLTSDQSRAIAEVLRTGVGDRAEVLGRLSTIAEATNTIRIELQVAGRAMKASA